MDYDLTPALVLTAAGATIAAGAITSAVQILKGIFPIIVSKSLEQPLAFVLTVALVAYSYVATIGTPDAVNVLAALIAMVGILKLSTGIYDTAVSRGILPSGEDTAKTLDVAVEETPEESADEPAGPSGDAETGGPVAGWNKDEDPE